MKKKYYKPRIVIEVMNTPLLEDVSNVTVGGSGKLDSKGFSSGYYGEFYDDEE